MKKEAVLALALLFCAPVCVRAQGALFKKALDGAVKNYEKKTVFSAPAQAARTAALQTLTEEKLLETMGSGYFTKTPQSASALAAERNEALREELLKNWLERNAYLSARKADLSSKVKLTRHTGTIDYVSVIPSYARVILLGEMHEKDFIVSEVETAIKQYQKAYPGRTVYYASEFVDDLNPLLLAGSDVMKSERQITEAVRKRPYYADVTRRLFRAGVNVVGLEDPLVSERLLAENYRYAYENAPSVWRYASPAGIEERNIYWARIIERIYQQDPNAVVFVHAGMAHTNYNGVKSLPFLLKKHRPFVVEYNFPPGRSVNMLLEKYAPFPANFPAYLHAVQRNAPAMYPKIRVMRQITDKRAAISLGCDVSIVFPTRFSK